MKTLALIGIAICFVGCAINRPYIAEKSTGTNGVVNERIVKSTSLALWPATTELSKQRVSAGKTLTVGTDGLSETTGGTNVVDALRALDSILGKIR